MSGVAPGGAHEAPRCRRPAIVLCRSSTLAQAVAQRVERLAGEDPRSAPGTGRRLVAQSFEGELHVATELTAHLPRVGE